MYLEDSNDHSPVFAQQQFNVRVRNTTMSGEFVIGTTALDPDQGSNGTVRYSLEGTDSALFTIGPNTGKSFS